MRYTPYSHSYATINNAVVAAEKYVPQVIRYTITAVEGQATQDGAPRFSILMLPTDAQLQLAITAVHASNGRVAVYR